MAVVVYDNELSDLPRPTTKGSNVVNRTSSLPGCPLETLIRHKQPPAPLEDPSLIFSPPYPTPPTGPYFDPRRTANVTALRGVTTHLVCRVKRLGNHTVRKYFILARTFVRTDSQGQMPYSITRVQISLTATLPRVKVQLGHPVTTRQGWDNEKKCPCTVVPMLLCTLLKEH